ncbi:Ankyrin repeat and zinc finger domain-containing protein 1 [Quillaja saponaria]|uniref:Ankyrin repeat and zinc finger domain-containing protein 1 n=1 Tax=Quillaja saponaria TaxID=32244 RepID=A0AAD7L418_QUISA|nr:Ankyrin repeat and zinc finger domain-containing protein 1 [Quillaja saponaria]
MKNGNVRSSEVPSNFFDSCRLLPSLNSSISDRLQNTENLNQSLKNLDLTENKDNGIQNDVVALPRWTCNTCKVEFDSLQDQRSHFKSDIHRFNVKLTIAGKNIVKEEDFEELTSDSFQDYDVSSISGSEDEDETASGSLNDLHRKSSENFKKKLLVFLPTGERVSIWKCLVMNELENISYNDKEESDGGHMPCLRDSEVIERLKSLISEPRNNNHLRIVLLATGGHFAGCVFDGDVVVAQKTFHRYVVRAKAGKKQSSKDASGRVAHSAGASLRRYNELALKKEIQELLTAWRPYFDASACIFVYAPSNNRQLLYDGQKPYFSNPCHVRNIPLTIRRPTLKEAKRVYSQLTQVSIGVDDKEISPSAREEVLLVSSTTRDGNASSSKEDMFGSEIKNKTEACSSSIKADELPLSSDGENENELTGKSTPLHEAAKFDDASKVLDLLEQGLDPCLKDERGRTPYILAGDKEVRNTFRRFMATNLDKWDWEAAKVPSALTKEMEESQAAKQAEKDAKRKARAKELKKLRKAKEKAQAQAALPQNASTVAGTRVITPASVLKGQSQSNNDLKISKEEELRRAQVAEREKRAAAAERRMAAAAAGSNVSVPTTSQPKGGLAGDINCSCCNTSLAGKVPFHRYNYKYCSTSCMHVHRQILEDQ